MSGSVSCVDMVILLCFVTGFVRWCPWRKLGRTGRKSFRVGYRIENGSTAG